MCYILCMGVCVGASDMTTVSDDPYFAIFAIFLFCVRFLSNTHTHAKNITHTQHILGTWLEAHFSSIVDRCFMDYVAYFHILILVMIMSCCDMLG
jgi:hypothetical protein